MNKMFRFLVVLLFIVMRCESRCTDEGAYVQCDSTFDARVAGNQKNWTKLYVKSYGDKETIDAEFLRYFPTVTKLDFENVLINIRDNAFADGSTSISYLTFTKCELPVVKAKWFSGTSVRQLDIYDSKLTTTFEERCFDGIERLRLYGNNITRLNANVFSGIPVEELFLKNNQIRDIGENTFANMTKLVELSLDENLLTSFNSKRIVGSESSSLTDLNLSSNKIKYLDEDSFVMFPNINRIFLESNELEVIGEGTFNELNQLYYLGLHSNKLRTISSRAFSYDGLPSLDTLRLDKNRLSYLPRHFIRNFPQLKRISIFPNPWQCACYKQLVHNLVVHHKDVLINCLYEYTNGERPVCVVPNGTNSEKCRENIEDKWSENFTETSNNEYSLGYC